jgi:hypothetical protein
MAVRIKTYLRLGDSFDGRQRHVGVQWRCDDASRCGRRPETLALLSHVRTGAFPGPLTRSRSFSRPSTPQT